MYSDLPEPLKQKVLNYLLADNFAAAKEVHDAWVSEEHAPMTRREIC